MKLELELERDSYSRDMGTFGKLSVFYAYGEELEPGPQDQHDMGAEPIPLGHDYGSFTRGYRDKVFECETVERPWANNAPNISCIPEGTYELKQRLYYRGNYPTLELQDVPGRSLILIHKGNTMLDVEGCIAVGKGRGVLGDKWAVLESRNAFTALSKLMNPRGDQESYDSASITIRQYQPLTVDSLDAR